MKLSLRKLSSVVLSLIFSNAGAAVRYVDVNSANPMSPYTNWATAATTIQQAIDVAVAGDQILVTNGVYQTGATAVYGMSNRVAVTKSVTVQSINGPTSTIIWGYWVPSTINGASAIRCVYLTNGAVLSGFTLAHGATGNSGDIYTQLSGGGVWCESTNAVVTNCVLYGNSAYYLGGGAFRGSLNYCTMQGNLVSAYGGGGAWGSTLNHCTLTGNSATNSATTYGGGALSCTLNYCTLNSNLASEGGGTYGSTLSHCTLTGNAAISQGGGALGGRLEYCILTGNSTDGYGGGVCGAGLSHCTLTGNSALLGGGAYDAVLTNCIAYYNRARQSGDNYHGESLTISYSCTVPLPGWGAGNISAEPRLASASRLEPVMHFGRGESWW